jgi:hypothetical protein
MKSINQIPFNFPPQKVKKVVLLKIRPYKKGQIKNNWILNRGRRTILKLMGFNRTMIDMGNIFFQK